MKVIHHMPRAWFFLQNGDDYYIHVNCSVSIFGFSIAVQLNSSEIKDYLSQGVGFVDELGELIAQKSDLNHPRNITSKELLDEIQNSIMAWINEQA